MNIWLMQTGEPLPIEQGVRKMRSAILADKLLEHGHEVLWWAGAFEHQRKIMVSSSDANFVVFEQYVIRVLRGCKYRKNVSFLRYLNYQIISLKFRFQSKGLPKPDIIIASMPDHLLAYEAVRYAKTYSIPIIIDIRDLWPDIFVNHFKEKRLYGIGKLALVLDFAKLNFLLKNADSLVAVSKGYLNWGLKKIGRSEGSFDKVLYLGYKKTDTANRVNRNENRYTPDWIKGREAEKLFLFIGTFGVSYELELIIEAAKRFEKSGKFNICFVMAGTGEKFDLLKMKSTGLRNIVLPGWIGEKEIHALLKICYAGLVPCRSVVNTIPNKPFEYLSAGIPLVNSLEGEMAELVNEHGLGLNYKPGDLEGLSKCVEQLADDRDLHDKMSKNAEFFFEKYGDADSIYEEYVTHIERVV